MNLVSYRVIWRLRWKRKKSAAFPVHGTAAVLSPKPESRKSGIFLCKVTPRCLSRGWLLFWAAPLMKTLQEFHQISFFKCFWVTYLLFRTKRICTYILIATYENMCSYFAFIWILGTNNLEQQNAVGSEEWRKESIQVFEILTQWVVVLQTFP